MKGVVNVKKLLVLILLFVFSQILLSWEFLLRYKDYFVVVKDVKKEVIAVFYNDELKPVRQVFLIKGSLFGVTLYGDYILCAGESNGYGVIFRFDTTGVKHVRYFKDVDYFKVVVHHNGYLLLGGWVKNYPVLYITDINGNTIYERALPCCGKVVAGFWRENSAILATESCLIEEWGDFPKIQRFSTKILYAYGEKEIHIVFKIGKMSVGSDGKVLAKEPVFKVIPYGSDIYSISFNALWKNGMELIKLPFIYDFYIYNGKIYILTESGIKIFDRIEKR